MSKPLLKKCQCGKTLTNVPLPRCRPCEKCGFVMHNQYHVLYHPGCKSGT